MLFGNSHSESLRNSSKPATHSAPSIPAVSRTVPKTRKPTSDAQTGLV